MKRQDCKSSYYLSGITLVETLIKCMGYAYFWNIRPMMYHHDHYLLSILSLWPWIHLYPDHKIVHHWSSRNVGSSRWYSVPDAESVLSQRSDSIRWFSVFSTVVFFRLTCNSFPGYKNGGKIWSRTPQAAICSLEQNQIAATAPNEIMDCDKSCQGSCWSVDSTVLLCLHLDLFYI